MKELKVSVILQIKRRGQRYVSGSEFPVVSHPVPCSDTKSEGKQLWDENKIKKKKKDGGALQWNIMISHHPASLDSPPAAKSALKSYSRHS